jgi:hypothetical protein
LDPIHQINDSVWEVAAEGLFGQHEWVAVVAMKVRRLTEQHKRVMVENARQAKAKARVAGNVHFVGYESGPNASRVGGVFELTEKVHNDRPVYRQRLPNDDHLYHHQVSGLQV